MDYEEKYKDLVKRLNKAREEKGVYTFNSVLDAVAPELKESEDERIRKEMIFYFTEEIPQCSIQEHSDKMREFISWLKRQKVERAKLELKAGNSYFCYKSRWERADSETFKKGLIYKCNKDGVLDNFVIKNPEQHFIEIKDERIAWLEKQGEQKPLNNQFTPEQANILDKHIDKFFEQNPAWSEEDEKMIRALVSMCDVWATSHQFYPKENKEMEALKTWLKYLKERYTWKPSDEQIEAFEHFVRSIGESGYASPYDNNTKLLYSLLSDLKKLKE